MTKKLALLQKISLPGSDDAKLEGLLTVPEDCKILNVLGSNSSITSISHQSKRKKTSQVDVSTAARGH